MRGEFISGVRQRWSSAWSQLMVRIFAFVRNLSARIMRGSTPPAIKKIWLDFHNRCNYACIFCNVHKISPSTLRLKDFKNFDEILTMAEEVDITGYGELLTHPDARELIQKLSNSRKKFSLVSNGSQLNDELLELLDQSSLHLLSISLNSLRDDTYRLLTGNDLQPVLRNIERIYSKPRHFQVKFTFVITAYNVDEMISFIDFGKTHDAHITFYGLIPTIKDYPAGLQLANNVANRAKLEQAIAHARELGVDLLPFDFAASRDEDGVMFDAAAVNLSEKIKQCPVVYHDVFISTQGDVTPCCYILKTMGNIKEMTLMEIWHGKEYKDLRKCIERGDLKYCRNCRMFG